MQNSPIRMESSRLVARCWREEDAEDFRALLDRNDRHLRPFIQWMRDEPMTLDGTRQRLAGYRGRFLAGEDFRYALLDSNEQLVGELMLSTRSGDGSRELGYLLDQSSTGRGLATEAARLGLWAAFKKSGVGQVELFCAPENRASIRIAEKLGFTLVETLPAHGKDSEGELRDAMHWRITAAEYSGQHHEPGFRVSETD